MSQYKIGEVAHRFYPDGSDDWRFYLGDNSTGGEAWGLPFRTQEEAQKASNDYYKMGGGGGGINWQNPGDTPGTVKDKPKAGTLNEDNIFLKKDVSSKSVKTFNPTMNFRWVDYQSEIAPGYWHAHPPVLQQLWVQEDVLDGDMLKVVKEEWRNIPSEIIKLPIQPMTIPNENLK